jgi:hypothetical protein
MSNVQSSTINSQGREQAIIPAFYRRVQRLIAHLLTIVFAIGKE